MGKYREIFIIK